MKRWMLILIVILVFTAVLTACGGTGSGESALSADGVNPTAVIAAVVSNDAALSTDFSGALPLEAQLAFGTMQLEDTSLAVTTEQAQVLLPYWRVLQSLTANGNAADAEISAVVKQIENGMSGEQIAAISAMALSEEKLQTMIEEGAIAFGRGAGEEGQEGQGGGGIRPGGGIPGAGPGGGRGPGGGLGGDPGALETRQAELAESGESPLGAFIDRASSGMIIRLLETKTGEAPARGFGGIGAALAAVGELTGLSSEELNEAMAEGQTLGDIVEANGVSLDEARGAIVEAMADVQLPEDQDIESWVDGMLSGTFGGQRQE